MLAFMGQTRTHTYMNIPVQHLDLLTDRVFRDVPIEYVVPDYFELDLRRTCGFRHIPVYNKNS